MTEPYRWEDQPAEKRVDWNERQGRGPVRERKDPTTWLDVCLFIVFVTCVVCAFKGWFPAGVMT